MVLLIYICVVLGIGSIYDWKYYALPYWLLGVGLLGGAVGLVMEGIKVRSEWGMAFLALLPGVVTLLAAFATREQVGYGDGVLILAMGGCMGLERTVWAVFAALAGTFVVSCILLISGRAQRSVRVPFVPFLLVGVLIVAFGTVGKVGM